MKIKKIFLIAFLFFLLCNLERTSPFDLIRELPEEVPVANYTGNVFRIFLPTYYNEKSGCYGDTKPVKRITADKNYTTVNTFSVGSDARIGFLYILRPKKQMMFSGNNNFALFRINEKEDEWENVPFMIDVSSPQWKYGDVISEGNYLNFGKEKCHFLPGYPIYLYPEGENWFISGTYRLYAWGFDVTEQSYAFVGDFVEFELLP